MKPKSSLAKATHAGMTHRDTVAVSFLQSCYYDIRDSFLFDVDLQSYKEWLPTTGSGPSHEETLMRKITCEKQCAIRL